MRGSTALKIPEAIPRPRPMGIVICLTGGVSLAAGILRSEPALILSGTLILAVTVYCFLLVFLHSLLHRKNAFAISVRIVPETASIGSTCNTLLDWNSGISSGKQSKFFRFPGILIRYIVELSTIDERRIVHSFDPGHEHGKNTKSGSAESISTSFTVKERGAYYGKRDTLEIIDSLGLFCAAYTLIREASPRLLVLPRSGSDPVPLTIRSGGDEQRRDLNFQKTDNLIDHRPYMPGDDPRRINWKLYSHAGELFVREGENAPPPHGRLLILLDSQYESDLYKKEESRAAVDQLCETALTLAAEIRGKGLEVTVDYVRRNGVQGPEPDCTNISEILSFPAALKMVTDTRAPGAAFDTFPEIEDGRSILILALPRAGGSTSALEQFLKNRKPGQDVDLVFICGKNGLEIYAETCVRLYGQKGGVHARYISKS
ncbi:hypothetical protein FACS1894151_11130 [Spirochaetia bacterium]|nr:hypothetical protein FACS1894151_11130 [Spirochaetia bacterium]